MTTTAMACLTAANQTLDILGSMMRSLDRDHSPEAARQRSLVAKEVVLTFRQATKGAWYRDPARETVSES